MENHLGDFQQKSVLEFNLRILQIFGLWGIENKLNRAHKVYRFVMVIFFSLHVFSQVTGVVQLARDNLLDALELIYIPALSTGLFIKVWYMVKYEKGLEDLINSMDEGIFKPRTTEQAEFVEKYTHSMGVLFRTFIIASIFTWTLFYATTLKNIQQRSLPIAGAYPYKQELFFVYYLFQGLEELLVAFCNVSVHCIITGFLCHMRMQLHLLNENLKNIEALSVQKLDKRQGISPKNSVVREKLQDMMDETLVECVEHYGSIIKMKTDFEDTFGATIFFVMIVDCFVICMTLWQFIVLSFRSFKFFDVLVYLTCVITELLLFCWPGNELILKSSEVPYSAYESEWIHRPLYYQKNLLLFMTITVQPIQITAGYFSLSIQTFIYIMRAAWSYFTFLRQSFV